MTSSVEQCGGGARWLNMGGHPIILQISRVIFFFRCVSGLGGIVHMARGTVGESCVILN